MEASITHKQQAILLSKVDGEGLAMVANGQVLHKREGIVKRLGGKLPESSPAQHSRTPLTPILEQHTI